LGNFFSNFTAEDNLVEGNTINLPNSSGGSVGVAVAELQKGTIVKENIFKAIPAAGVFVGVLRVPADPGTWPTDVLIEGNTLMGPMGNGIRIGDTFDPIIQGNSITGSTNFGIFIRGNAIETATITRNRIFNNGFGLRFRRDAFNSNATFYGAKIFLNDITGSTTQAVSRTANYNLTLCPDCTTELSVGVQGNYWGRPCSDSNGFREFGETGADSPAAFIKDSHPYEDSVAGKSDEELLEIEPCQ
jgi:parallel beta-helix repeat protein